MGSIQDVSNNNGIQIGLILPLEQKQETGFQYETGALYAGAGVVADDETDSSYTGAMLTLRRSWKDMLSVKIGHMERNAGSLAGFGAGFALQTEHNMSGFQAGGSIVSRGDITGGQVGLAGVVARRDMTGVQVGMTVAAVRKMTGWQVGFGVFARRDLTGFQAGLYVGSEEGSLHGFQIGLVTYSKEKASGLQLGVVTAEEGFYKLFGLIPVYDDGSFKGKVDSSISEALTLAHIRAN